MNQQFYKNFLPAEDASVDYVTFSHVQIIHLKSSHEFHFLRGRFFGRQFLRWQITDTTSRLDFSRNFCRFGVGECFSTSIQIYCLLLMKKKNLSFFLFKHPIGGGQQQKCRTKSSSLQPNFFWLLAVLFLSDLLFASDEQ